MYNAASISRRPFPRVTESSRGTGPPNLRAPTVLSVTSGAGGGKTMEEPSEGHEASGTAGLLSL